MTDLRSALLPAAKIVPKKSRVPVLGCLKIGDGKAIANNLDMEVTVDVDALDIEPTCVPAKPLIEALGAVGNGRVSIEGSKVVVDGDRGRISIGKLEDPGWPDGPCDGRPNEAPIRLTTEHRDAIARLLSSMNREQTRYYLNGIALSDGYAVSTDGHRLRAVPMWQANGAGHNIILPAAAARWIAQSKGDFDLRVGMAGFSFVNGSVRATGRMIDGTFPDWHRGNIVPPKDTALRAIFDAGKLREAVATVSALDRSRSKATKLTIANECIIVESKQIDFDIEARAEIEAETFGDSYSVGFNAKYLLDILKPDGGIVEMRQEFPAAPCRLIFADCDEIVVQMAMRI